MMELLDGYPPDVFAAVWHDVAYDRQGGAIPSQAERDRIAGAHHDVRILAKYARGAKPVSKTELEEHEMLGMGQWRDFGRIAVVTDERWVRHAVQFFAPFFHGPVHVFANAAAQEARLWIDRHDHH